MLLSCFVTTMIVDFLRKKASGLPSFVTFITPLYMYMYCDNHLLLYRDKMIILLNKQVNQPGKIHLPFFNGSQVVEMGLISNLPKQIVEEN
jgi:hypothetical protein